jgi:hypothetical protein
MAEASGAHFFKRVNRWLQKLAELDKAVTRVRKLARVQGPDKGWGLRQGYKVQTVKTWEGLKRL